MYGCDGLVLVVCTECDELVLVVCTECDGLVLNVWMCTECMDVMS